MPPPDADTLPDIASGGELIETAYAKVNLALHVRERRGDGYHQLESLFIFARDGDVLTARAADALTLDIEGPFGAGLDCGAGNLVMMAAAALKNYLGEGRGAALRLVKNLPVASGIGGGSADAAAALRLLDRLWEAHVPVPELERIALSIGSDVPACVASTTQMVRGRGELLDQREIVGLAGMPMLLVNPGVALSTAKVFAGWDQVDRGALKADSLTSLTADGRNDLEPAALALAPAIGEVLEALRQCSGVRLARMSGSGATCFALFEDAGDARAAAAALRSLRMGWWIMETEIRAA